MTHSESQKEPKSPDANPREGSLHTQPLSFISNPHHVICTHNSEFDIDMFIEHVLCARPYAKMTVVCIVSAFKDLIVHWESRHETRSLEQAEPF